MANIFSPNGFWPVRRYDGAAWTGNMTQYLIASGNSHSFFQGDPVIILNTGYIDDVAVGSLPTQGVRGIFMGCEFQNTTSGTPWANYYPAASTANVVAWVIDDPMVVFRAWVGTTATPTAGGPVTQANIGENISYQQGTGNTASGISGSYVDYNVVGTSATLPFTIVSLVTGPPGVNGTDVTTAGNICEVVFNQSAFKVGTTGV